MNKKKKQMKADRREKFFQSRPIFVKIDVEEGNTNIFRYRGRLDEGWRQFKKLCIDQYQIDNSVTFDFSLIIDGLSQLKMIELPVYSRGNEDDGRKKK